MLIVRVKKKGINPEVPITVKANKKGSVRTRRSPLVTQASGEKLTICSVHMYL